MTPEAPEVRGAFSPLPSPTSWRVAHMLAAAQFGEIASENVREGLLEASSNLKVGLQDLANSHMLASSNLKEGMKYMALAVGMGLCAVGWGIAHGFSGK